MECRIGCGMCCIAPSIVQPMPGMPEGKSAGQPSVNLDLETYTCRIWGSDNYPLFCHQFQAEEAFCGSNRSEAEQILTWLEEDTRPHLVK